MKNIFFNLLFVLIIQFSFSQEINKFDANNKRHGIWKKKFNNGRIRYQGEFNHGKEVGVFKYFSAASSDKPIIIKTFNDTNITADVKFYTPKGKLQSIGQMNGKERIGKWVYYHKDGKTIMQEEYYVDNKLDGSYKTFYPNGKPTVITTYTNGKLNGKFLKYAIINKIYQDLNYINGKLEGGAIYYDRKTGLITEKGQYRNDIRVGEWEYYVDGEFSHKDQIVPKIKKK